MKIALLAAVISMTSALGCAATPGDDGDTGQDEAALSSRARPYVGEYVEVAFSDQSAAASTLRLTGGGTFSLAAGGTITRGRYTVVKGRKVLRPDFQHAYEDRTVEVEQDLLRLTADDGTLTEYFVGSTYLQDAVLATNDDATTFWKRLKSASCARTTCNTLTRCVDVENQSGRARAICLEREWSLGSGE